MQSRRRRTGWSFKRYFFRIFLPFVVVALIALGMRVYLAREFNERHVRLETGEETSTEAVEGSGFGTTNRDSALRGLEFNEENRATVIAGLESAKSALDEGLASAVKRGDERHADLMEAKDRKERFDAQIERLRTVEKAGWPEARDAAYEGLDTYGEAVKALAN